MHEIIQHLQGEGFSVRGIIPDGKIYRHSKDKNDTKKTLWSLCHQNHTRNGELFHVCVYGDWSDSAPPKVFHTLKGRVSAEDKKYIKKQVDNAVKKGEEDREIIQEEAAKECLEIWNKLSDSGEHEYLKRKKIDSVPNLGIKYDNFNETIYIPGRDINGKLWTLQRITRDGTKLFSRGGRISECYHVIGDLEKEGRIYVAEGFATAASIHLATNDATICTFNSGNLGKVYRRIREVYGEREIVICGDEDLWTKRPDGTPYNPGREAAESVGNCVFPRFKQLIEKKTTDFNDLHCFEGIQQVKEQLEGFKTVQERLAVYALGYDDTGFYYTSTNNKYIMCFSSPGEADLVKLAPVEYWEQLYPGGGSTRINWSEARSGMIEQAQRRGIFRHINIRGAGVWMDEDRVIINTGGNLVFDGKTFDYGKIKSKYFYTPGAFLDKNLSESLSVKDAQILIKSIEGFNWSKKESGKFLAGALVLSKICGAIPIRPHVWVTGAAKTGKTSLMENIVNKIIGDYGIYAQGNTTEAGIRQRLKNDAIPVMLDEFETDGKKTDERVVSLVELMRAAWSDSTACLIKGSAGGRSQTFNARFSAIVSSIRCNLTNDADISRFAVLELSPHNSDNDKWESILDLMSNFDNSYADKLFCRSIKMLPIVLANFKLLRAELSKIGGARFGDTYGMLLAGYSILITDRALTQEDAQFLVKEINLDEQLDESKISDHEDCLDKLLSSQITYDTPSGRKTDTIANLIQICTTGIDTSADHALQLYGVRVFGDGIAIAGRAHSGLQSIYRNTKWSDIWNRSLARFDGVLKGEKKWIAGKDYRCIILPLNLFK